MKKIMIYCQHLAGMGHLVRCREIMQALVADFEVCFVCGGQSVPQFQLPDGVEVVYLPALWQKGDQLVPLDKSYTLDPLKEKRKGLLLETFERFQPDCLMTECFPFSKMSMKYELSPLLKKAKASEKSVRIVCSLRDLIMTQPLSDGARERREAKVKRLIDRFYDAILIHADPSFQKLEDCFSRVNELSCKIFYTGYVAQSAPSLLPSINHRETAIPYQSPSIVASAGGGRHGYPLLSAVIAASPLIMERFAHHIYVFAGPFMPEGDFLKLQKAAADKANVTLRRFTNQLLDYFNQADLSISFGGYNTTMNLLSTGVRSLLLPSLNPSQADEQRIRAEKLSHMGVVTLLNAKALVPERLVGAISAALDQSPSPHQIDLGGAGNAATYLRGLLLDELLDESSETRGLPTPTSAALRDGFASLATSQRTPRAKIFKRIFKAMKKKVCITTLEFPPDVGGVGQSVSRIAHMLMDLGYEVHVVVFRAVFRNERAMAAAGQFRSASCHTSQQDNITVHRLQTAVRFANAKAQDYLCDLHSQIKALHGKYRFDIFHAFFINEMGFLTTLLAKENGVPVINSVRGADLNKHIFSPAQFGQVAWTLKHSDWTTFVSRDLMQRARVLVPEITTRTSAFWNSIVPLSFDDLPTPALVDQLKGTVIGSVGSFRDKKGLEFLIEACETLGRTEPLTLLLVGDFAEKERGYWGQVLAQSRFKRIVVTGKVSRQEAIAYLPHMDIFAIPSLRDGCPNALLEAMLAAKAVVGTQVDAIGEIIEDGVDGLCVPPSDSDALTGALSRLVQQPDLREQLGMAARQKVLTQMMPAREQHDWDMVYQQALSAQRPSEDISSTTAEQTSSTVLVGVL